LRIPRGRIFGVDPLAIELGKEAIVTNPSLVQKATVAAADELIRAALQLACINAIVSGDEGADRSLAEGAFIFDPCVR
jgi:hypothetical protein